MARKAAVPKRWSLADLERMLATAAPASATPGDSEHQAPSGDDRDAAETAPPLTVLLLFDRGTPDDVRLGRVLAAVAGSDAARLEAAAMPAAEAVQRLQAWQGHRRAFDTFDFRRWPAVGAFRRGRLVTTFHPRRVFFGEALQEREEREQLEIFLSKMVYYDPAQVKEQKGLELEVQA